MKIPDEVNARRSGPKKGGGRMPTDMNVAFSLCLCGAQRGNTVRFMILVIQEENTYSFHRGVPRLS